MLTRVAVCLFAVAGLTLPLVAADELKGDLAKVQGTWKAKVGPDKNIPLVLIVKKTDVSVKFTTPDGEERELKGQIKLDEQAKPKTWDWVKFTRPDGEDAQDNLAIYEIDGDTLKICSGGPGNARPSEFRDGEGGEPPHTVSFQRDKEAK